MSYGLQSHNSYLSSFISSSTLYGSASGTILSGFPTSVSEKGLKEYEKRRKIEEKMRKEALAKRTLVDLPVESKQILMNIVHSFYRQYKFEQEVNKLMAGFKWFLFLLGLAIFFNFGRILNLIELMIK